MFVRVSVAVIVAPGTAPPLSSVTFPTSVPTATCANANTGANKIPTTESVETTRNENRLPVIALLLPGWIDARTQSDTVEIAPRLVNPCGGRRTYCFCRGQYRVFPVR